ncbi:MAG: energy-dependent translational throttle protein EttA, partial [Gemmatimonadaceae bacterium]
MAPQFIYVMKDLRKVVPPSREILKGIWLSFYPGAKIGVLGPNGAGKSTLLRIMAGVDQDFQGEAWAHAGTKIGYLSQEPQLDPTKTVRENVEEAVKETRDLLKKFEEISMKFAEPMTDDEMNKLLDQQGRVQEKIDAANAWELDRQIEIAMDALRLPPGDAAVANLSGGEKRRVALCRVLLEQPDILLLDEPTNHLDAESVAWLERHLAEFPGTVVAITHDRYFLDNVAQYILELDRGAGIPYEGNYTSWLEQKRSRLQVEEKQESARQRTLERELEWVRMAPRARQAKNQARVKRYEELAEADTAERATSHEIVIPPPPRLGNDVVTVKNLRKAYGDKLLYEDLTFSLPRGGIVGVIGPNGAGKTTMFRMMAGTEQPDSGSLTVGDTVVLAYADQDRALDGGKTVYDEVSGGNDLIQVGKREMNARAYLASFNF